MDVHKRHHQYCHSTIDTIKDKLNTHLKTNRNLNTTSLMHFQKCTLMHQRLIKKLDITQHVQVDFPLCSHPLLLCYQFSHCIFSLTYSYLFRRCCVREGVKRKREDIHARYSEHKEEYIRGVKLLKLTMHCNTVKCTRSNY